MAIVPFVRRAAAEERDGAGELVSPSRRGTIRILFISARGIGMFPFVVKISAFVMGLGLVTSVQAAGMCGDPPPHELRSTSSRDIKGDLQGKAQLLTKYVGDAQLGGQITSSLREAYQAFPDAGKALTNQWFLYLFCELLLDPKNNQPIPEKIKALSEFRKQISDDSGQAADAQQPVRDLKHEISATRWNFYQTNHLGSRIGPIPMVFRDDGVVLLEDHDTGQMKTDGQKWEITDSGFLRVYKPGTSDEMKFTLESYPKGPLKTTIKSSEGFSFIMELVQAVGN